MADVLDFLVERLEEMSTPESRKAALEEARDGSRYLTARCRGSEDQYAATWMLIGHGLDGTWDSIEKALPGADVRGMTSPLAEALRAMRDQILTVEK